MFEGVKNLLQKSRHITLLTHKGAGKDGDALGSMLSLALFFLQEKFNPHPFCREKVASNFLFLSGVEMLDDKFSSQTDLLIFLDCADYKRGDFDNKVYNLIDIVPSILIDHHPRGDLSRFVEYKIQDPQAASTTELIFCLLEFLGAHIDKRIATALLTGIITDTNSFLNPNTTDKTFVVAARLLSYGARIERVVANLFYQKSCAALKLWGRALSRLQYNQGHDLLLSYLTENDLRECNVSVQEAEGIVNFLNLNAAHKAKAVLFLIENQGKIKGSFRTTAHNIDVSEMARQFGGGGHKKAAGFEIEGSLVLKEGELVM